MAYVSLATNQLTTWKRLSLGSCRSAPSVPGAGSGTRPGGSATLSPGRPCLADPLDVARLPASHRCVVAAALATVREPLSGQPERIGGRTPAQPNSDRFVGQPEAILESS